MTHTQPALLVLALALLCSCASMVNKDAVKSVKTAAIISVWGNGEVPEYKNRGKVRSKARDIEGDFGQYQGLGRRQMGSAGKLTKAPA